MQVAEFNIKVFKKGGIIYVINTENDIIIEGYASGVNGERIVRHLYTDTEWIFLNFNSDSTIRNYKFPIENILKEDGIAYTNEEFIEFVENNTGVLSSIISIISQKNNNNVYQGSTPIIFPANTQSSLSISATDGDLEILCNGTTITLPSSTINWNADRLLNNEIQIISGNYLIVALGDKIV